MDTGRHGIGARTEFRIRRRGVPVASRLVCWVIALLLSTAVIAMPTIDGDLAAVVDESRPYSEVEQAIREAAKGIVGSVQLLDLYRGPQAGEGKKSFAMRLVLRSPDRTLSEADVEKTMKRIEGRLLHQLGATIR